MESYTQKATKALECALLCDNILEGAPEWKKVFPVQVASLRSSHHMADLKSRER